MMRPSLAPLPRGGLDEFLFLQGHGLTAHQASGRHPVDQPDADEHPDQPTGLRVDRGQRLRKPVTGSRQGRAQKGHDDDDEEQARDRIERIDSAHDRHVDFAAEMRGDETGGNADQEDHRLHDQPHGERYAGAVNEAAQDVATEVVRPNQ